MTASEVWLVIAAILLNSGGKIRIPAAYQKFNYKNVLLSSEVDLETGDLILRAVNNEGIEKDKS